MARGLKFRIQKVEGLYYPSNENKGAEATAKLICGFVLARAKSRFSHDAAQMFSLCKVAVTQYEPHHSKTNNVAVAHINDRCSLGS